MIPPDDADRGFEEVDVLAELEDLRARVTLLERERRRVRSVEDGDRFVLSALLELDATEFHAADVVEAGRLHPRFRKVLLDADLTTEASVGYLLRRTRGLLVGHYRLERIGRDARGVIWAFVAE